MYTNDKREAHRRAMALLSSGKDEDLLYATLEFRFTLEAITYQKVQSYSARLPESIYASWQPPQLMRLLLELEPRADRNFAVRIAEEGPDGTPIGEWQWLGEHKTLALARLRKLYNKLGNHLHLPPPSRKPHAGGARSPDLKRLRAELEAIGRELEPIVSSSFDATMAEIFTFECVACRQQIVRNVESARNNQSATCLNAACNADYHLEIQSDGNVAIQLKVTAFDCQQCGAQIPIQNRHLEIGYQFKCPKCRADHQLAGRHWSYGQIAPEPEPPKSGG